MNKKEKMNKVFTIIIKAELNITQFLCTVVTPSVTRLQQEHAHSGRRRCTCNTPPPATEAATVAERNSSYKEPAPGAPRLPR